MSGDWTLHLRNENRICHVQVKNIVHEELQTEPEYLQKIRIVQKNNFVNCTQHSWMEDVDVSSHDYLRTICRLGYELAVLWFDGSWPQSDDFETKLLEYHDGAWKDKDWMCAGHIINRPGRYPHWHHQCIVINLKEWNIGQPKIHNFAGAKHSGFIASEECIHDDYTPLELKPDETQNCRNLQVREDFADQFIHWCMGNNYTVLNIPEDVREEKICIYPEDDIELTKRWLLDPNFLNDKTQEEIYEYGFNRHTVPEDKLELWGYKIQHIQVLYVTNTESVPFWAPTPGFTTVAVPCSGLHQFWHIAKHIDTLEKVVWFDFNPYAVEWTKLVLNEWSGEDFDAFYKDNIHRILENSVINPDCVLYNVELVNKFMERMGDEWPDIWRSIRELKHEFLCVDIVKDWNKLIMPIGFNGKVFMQLTNIWQYESNYLNTDGFTAQKAFIDLLTTVAESNDELYVTGDTPGGKYLQYQNIKLMTGLY